MQLTIDSEDIVGIKMSALEESQDNQVSALINDIKKDIQNNVKYDLKPNGDEAPAREDVVSISVEGKADIIDVKPEIQLEGRSEDEIIPNGAPETLNNDKENDVPKDSEPEVKVENNIENTVNSNVEIKKNQAIMDNMDTGNNNASSTQEETKKEDFKPLVKDSESEVTESIQTLDGDKIASEKLDFDIAKTLNEKSVENNEQIDDRLVSNSINSMEVCATENTDHNPFTSSKNDISSIVTKVTGSVDSSHMDIDVTEVIENSSKDEVDKSVIVENNKQLEIIAEATETTNCIPKDFNETNDVSVDEKIKLSKPIDQEKSENGDLKMGEQRKETPTDDNINSKNTIQSEETADPDVNSVFIEASKDKISSLSESSEQTSCKKVIEKITEDKSLATEENKFESEKSENIGCDKVIGSPINNATPTVIEMNNDKHTENEMIADISEIEPKSEPIDKSDSESNENIASEEVIGSSINDATPTVIESNGNKQSESGMALDVTRNEPKSEPIDKSDSSMSDNKSNDISVKTEVQQNRGDPNESKPITENPVVEKRIDTDCVSVSSMEVDDVEIVPTENIKTEIDKSQESSMDVSVTNNEDNVIEILDQDVVESTDNVESDNKTEINLDSKKINQPNTKTQEKSQEKVDISDEDDIKIVEDTETKPQTPKKEEPSVASKSYPVVCKLSNNLDILSDEEDEPPSKVSKVEEKKPEPEDKQCINIDDDDDIMLIEDTKETKMEAPKTDTEETQKTSDKVNDESSEKEASKSLEDITPKINEKEPITTDIESPKLSEKEASPPKESVKENKPLLPINFLKSAKKNLAEMTRDELEEFCILKIVEGIVDRSSLSDIKSKMKIIEKNMEEYKKKSMLLSKQNRDLQVVLKSVQEEQKNKPNTAITPLKITRSVGMQVLMMDKGPKKKSTPQNTNVNTQKPITRNMAQPARPQRTPSNNQNIPVPRLIPASPAKSTPSSPVTTIAKPQTPNGIRNTVSPAQKVAEKRPMTRQATTSSNMTVDLTDDEPPAKVNKSSPVPPVRLVPSQNLMAPVRGQMQNNPRKVFIPINGQGPNLVRGQTAVMLKSVPQPVGPRQRLPSMPRMASNPVRMNKITVNRHPAPLPDVMKQYQPPTWKALPPAPDLKLSKVENGIVISWKIEGYQEDSYEKIASYQLYAYQETSTPPSTALWKKIGDVKALPLPMACTLTQFMAGFKYYFAVRAVDVKSRLGPFSLPGSILLLNKM